MDERLWVHPLNFSHQISSLELNAESLSICSGDNRISFEDNAEYPEDPYGVYDEWGYVLNNIQVECEDGLNIFNPGQNSWTQSYAIMSHGESWILDADFYNTTDEPKLAQICMEVNAKAGSLPADCAETYCIDIVVWPTVDEIIIVYPTEICAGEELSFELPIEGNYTWSLDLPEEVSLIGWPATDIGSINGSGCGLSVYSQ